MSLRLFVAGGNVFVNSFKLTERAPSTINDEQDATNPTQPFPVSAKLREESTKEQNAHGKVYHNHDDSKHIAHCAGHIRFLLFSFHNFSY